MTTVDRLTDEQSLALSYAKAFGIILVVLGHYKNTFFNIYHPYLFHMPLFFFIGGYVFNPKKGALSVAKNIATKYIGYIIATYVALGTIASIISAHYSASLGKPFSGSLYSTITDTLNGNFHNNVLFLVSWFLFAYAWVTAIGFCVLKALCKLQKISCLTSSIALAMALCFVGMDYIGPAFRSSGITPENQWMNLLCQVVVGTGFYLLGWSARLANLRFNSLYLFIFLTAVFLVLREHRLVTSLVMSWSHYPSGFYVAITLAISGIYATFFLASLTSKGIGNLKLLRKIGDESKVIMSYHILSLVALDYVFYLLGQFNFKGVSLAVHYFFPGSMPLYVAVGVLLPLAVKELIAMANRTAIRTIQAKTVTH